MIKLNLEDVIMQSKAIFTRFMRHDGKHSVVSSTSLASPEFISPTRLIKGSPRELHL